MSRAETTVGRGTASELAACAWLLRHGYDVFRNVSPIGPVDIVAIRGGEVFRFDVKTRSSAYARYKKGLADGVLLLVVTPDGDCSIELPGRACPECSRQFFAPRTQKYCGKMCRAVAAERGRQAYRADPANSWQERKLRKIAAGATSGFRSPRLETDQ